MTTTTTPKPVPLSHYLTIHGKRQDEFAKSIGMARPSLSNIAAGRSTPRPKTRQRICKELGIENDQLCELLESSAELAAAETLERVFARQAAKLVRLARQLKRPTAASASIAETTGDVLHRLSHRWRGHKVTIVVPRRRSA
jgi:transcriptional regulator with XRE-family HTH domain